MTININNNYWDAFPAERVVRPFSALYNLDKSKGRKTSSSIMWALTMLTDPATYNPLSRMTREERLEELLNSYIGQKELDDVLELEEEFVNFKLSYIKKRYRFYQSLLEDRERYMKTLSYDTHASQLDSMLVNTKKIWDEFLKIKKEVDVEEVSYHTKGNREESASEKGLI